MTHLHYVTSAYLIAGLVVLVLIVRVFYDYRRQLHRLHDLETKGVRRRSDRS